MPNKTLRAVLQDQTEAAEKAMIALNDAAGNPGLFGVKPEWFLKAREALEVFHTATMESRNKLTELDEADKKKQEATNGTQEQPTRVHPDPQASVAVAGAPVPAVPASPPPQAAPPQTVAGWPTMPGTQPGPATEAAAPEAASDEEGFEDEFQSEFDAAEAQRLYDGRETAQG